MTNGFGLNTETSIKPPTRRSSTVVKDNVGGQIFDICRVSHFSFHNIYHWKQQVVTTKFCLSWVYLELSSEKIRYSNFFYSSTKAAQ